MAPRGSIDDTAMPVCAGRPADAAGLRVGGLTRLTSIDFPGRLAAVVFCQGCPWRCGYCHNPDLLNAGASTDLSWEQVLSFLEERVGLLDGVVFSGGEPTLQSALLPCLAQARALGFDTALHTGGMYPQRLAPLLPWLDWVGLDIKAPFHRYHEVTATPGSGVPVRESLRLLLDSGVQYECRTTWHSGLFPAVDLEALADELAALGVTRWALQECRRAVGGTFAITSDQIARFERLFKRFSLRRA